MHAGRPGSLIVGVLGLALVAESLTGLWLYGPALRRRARSRSVHRLLGAVSLVFAAVVGLSGAALAFTALTGADAPLWVLRRLHYGDFAGWTSRIVYAVAGITLPMLAITGFVIAARRHG